MGIKFNSLKEYLTAGNLVFPAVFLRLRGIVKYPNFESKVGKKIVTKVGKIPYQLWFSGVLSIRIS
jgi:hypothetical protein